MSDTNRPPDNDISMTQAGRANPLWRRIATELATEFETAQLPPGTRLPTESALASRFDVNRHTIRRALETLVRSGQVRVEQGKGAFIADDVLDYEISTRTRFSEWIRRQNRVPDGRTLRLRTVAATAVIADALRLAEGSQLILLERIALADGVPLSLADHYFPADRLPGIADALQRINSITEALRVVGVDDYVRHSTRVIARMPTAAEAEQLQMPRTRPLLVCDNINVDRTGTPVEFGRSRHPSSRVQLVFEP
jgi:GntR family phosphonate transport system transcriptional regulator